MTLNPWQRKAQERYGPRGAVCAQGKWCRASGPVAGEQTGWTLPLPTILERLAYERQECERCFGYKTNRWRHPAVDECLDCDGTGLSPDYRKAQEWAERLGLEDG